MPNLHLVEPSAFKTLEFTEKMEVGLTALLISGGLLLFGFLIIKYIGFPFFTGYSNKFEIGAFSIGSVSSIIGVGVAVTYLNSIAFVCIVCAIIYVIAQDW